MVSAGSFVLAVGMTWPSARHPASTVPQDVEDPMYFVWQLAWLGHGLRTAPLDVWTTNAFSGAKDSLAYTDIMLGYAPAALLAHGFHGALALYNLLFIFAAALSYAGAYALARVLGAHWAGALVCAGAFAYAPWRLSHERHLNVLSTGGIVLALALLAYGNGWRLDGTGPVTARRPRAVLAGWLVAAWQLSLGFAQGLSFSWVLAIICGFLGLRWLVRRPAVPNVRLVLANLAGAGVYGLTGLVLTVPYLHVLHSFPAAARTEGMVNFHSPSRRGLITAPAESFWWGPIQAGWRVGLRSPIEQTLLPGFVVIALAVLGLVLSTWTRSRRFALLAGGIVFAMFALGTNGPHQGSFTFMFLFNHVPGWSGVRTAGRLIVWVSLCLGLLAAGTVTWAADRLQARSAEPAEPETPAADRRGWSRHRWTAILLLPAIAVALEGIGNVPHPVVPDPPAALRSSPDPVLVLPISRIGDYLVMAWSADGWPELVNGGSGFDPPPQIDARNELSSFPDAQSVNFLRSHHVRTVVLLPTRAAGTPWEGAERRPVDGLGIVERVSGDTVVYDL